MATIIEENRPLLAEFPAMGPPAISAFSLELPPTVRAEEEEDEFEDFNEEDFDDEFDDDFEEEEDDFDYGDQELEGDVEESDDDSMEPDAVPDVEFDE